MKKVVICIRGGGVKSASSVGILKALEEQGIEPYGFSGTSIGGVVAALAAIGTPNARVLELLEEWATIFTNANRLNGGSGSKEIEEKMNAQCGNLTFKDLRKPLSIASNCGGLWFTKPFVFDQTNTPDVTLGEACRASSSFPVAYEHYKLEINGRRMQFWDGGMALNPYLPEYDNSIRICCSFRKDKVNLKSRYKNAWLIPEEKAEITLLPYVGKMGSFGTPKDIELAYIAGYNEAQKHMGEIMRKINT